MKEKDLEAGAQPVSFLCRATLKRDIETVAALDGISQADVIRRAVLADIRKRKVENVIGRREIPRCMRRTPMANHDAQELTFRLMRSLDAAVGNLRQVVETRCYNGWLARPSSRRIRG
jgi:hypothetical protein